MTDDERCPHCGERIDLPEFAGLPMVEEIGTPVHGFRVYRDEHGHPWIEVTEDGDAWTLGTMTEKFVAALREANDDA